MRAAACCTSACAGDASMCVARRVRYKMSVHPHPALHCIQWVCPRGWWPQRASGQSRKVARMARRPAI
jgi:hypothetical protein